MDLPEQARKLHLKRRKPSGNPLHHLSEQICLQLDPAEEILVPCLKISSLEKGQGTCSG